MTKENLGVEDESTIFLFLLESGCCKWCALRFTGDEANFNDSGEHKIDQNALSNGHSEHLLKKSKLNPCIICLDLLQEVSLESMVLSPELQKVLEYDSDTFVSFISFPTSVLIREHSMKIYMKDKFPKTFEDPHIIPLNRAWSLSIQNKLCKRLGKQFDKKSYLQIQFTTSYELDEEESSQMYLVQNKVKKPDRKKDVLSRNVIGDTLKTIDQEVFRRHISIPPQTPTKSLVLYNVSFKHDFIYIAGRYCKYSRNLFQTPWVNDEHEDVKSSVQEILFQSLDNTFNCSSLIFSSSGREDFDVRTLGRGRPFFVKICDPKVTKIPAEKFRLIEKNIRKTNLIKVRDLQFIPRKYVNNIKEGEQFKKKTYRALCIIDKPQNIANYIEKINSLVCITLEQKTPIRVYHRRSSDVRKKEIYSIKATSITGRNNLFELDVISQAGTYIKEFIHGDLGRTKPSLGQLIGGYVDIIALDVLDIHLDFPPSITGEEKIL